MHQFLVWNTTAKKMEGREAKRERIMSICMRALNVATKKEINGNILDGSKYSTFGGLAKASFFHMRGPKISKLYPSINCLLVQLNIEFCIGKVIACIYIGFHRCNKKIE
uniref:Uncharacterized protein n=1 Tax=Pelagomonas calceolata TaxID=35677 RepID=A0A7S3ZX15_9STRA|mmetsp:Transcript_4733/g.13483  ORF Transcript_4733/g.13483 Transcript_4733/m.13483 type:complete len:109 (+) Transcript_4733:887-1213(+)